MLMVLMVLLMTTAAATFAIYSTTIEIRSAGYARQAMQTSYLAENGAYAGISYIDAIGAQAMRTQYERTRVTAGTSTEVNSATLSRDSNLLRVRMSDLESTGGFTAPALETDMVRQPSLGPAHTGAYNATFNLNGTDMYRHYVASPGRNLTGNSQMIFVRMNLTARSSIAPRGDAPRGSDLRGYHETAVNARAMADVGPFPN